MILAQTYYNQTHQLGNFSHGIVGALPLDGDDRYLLLSAHSPPENKATFWKLEFGQPNLDTLGEYHYSGGVVYFNWNNLMQVSDDAIVIGGGAYSDSLGYDHPVVVKFDTEGEVLWETHVPAIRRKVLRDGIQLKKQGFAFCGFAREDHTQNPDFYLLRCDTLGQVLWERRFEFLGIQEAYSITKASDGGFVLAGTNKLNTGLIAMLIVKTDEEGNLEWTKLIKESKDFGLFMSIAAMPDGGYLLTGAVQELNSFKFDRYAARINVVGDTIWTRRYPTAGHDAFNIKAKALPDGNFVVGGSGEVSRLSNGITVYDVVGNLTCINGEGDIIWERFYQINGVNYQNFYGFTLTPDGGILAYGDAMNPSQRAWVIKTDSLGCIEPGCAQVVGAVEAEAPDGAWLSAGPNPFSGLVQLRWRLPQGVKNGLLRILDAKGQEVMRQPLSGGAPTGDVIWQNDRLPAGIYIASLETPGRTPLTFLMVKQ